MSSSVESHSDNLADRLERTGNGEALFAGIQVKTGAESRICNTLVAGNPVDFVLDVQHMTARRIRVLSVAITVTDHLGTALFTCYSALTGQDFEPPHGRHSVVCHIPKLPLAEGKYKLNLWMGADGSTADKIEDAYEISVAVGNYFGTGREPVARKHGPMLVDHRWQLGKQLLDTSGKT